MEEKRFLVIAFNVSFVAGINDLHQRTSVSVRCPYMGNLNKWCIYTGDPREWRYYIMSPFFRVRDLV